jgi:MFS family permease
MQKGAKEMNTPARENDTFRLAPIIAAVLICGVAEGMLLPLVATLLERRGVDAVVNGVGTTALYIGMLISLPFMEKPLRRFGYKTLLAGGLGMIALCLLLFPAHYSFAFWFLLRLIVGIGDSMLHFAAQTWIIVESPDERRGRNIAIYGFSFGAGFAAGPLLMQLLIFGTAAPFVVTALLCLPILIRLLILPNNIPAVTDSGRASSGPARYCQTFIVAWSGLLATFGYGFMEAALNNSFPVFAMRNGLGIKAVVWLLPAYVTGGLLTQIPLGILGDRIGRRRLLPAVAVIGAGIFSASGWFTSSFAGLLITFSAAGMATGSLYSLSMGYVGDRLQPSLVPLGNILMSFFYSVGCMAGPLAGSVTIRFIPRSGLFYSISAMLAIVAAGVLIQQRQSFSRPRSETSGRPPHRL